MKIFRLGLGLALLAGIGMMPAHAASSSAPTPSPAATSASATPRFEDFPAAVYHGKSARVRLVTKEDHDFRTRLTALSGQKPNFAGHYTLASWGCGASCVMTVAVDVRTGNVTWLPFTVCCWDIDVDEPIQFKPNSRLVMIQGSRNENGGGTYYYALEKNGFVLVKAIEKPAK